MTDLEPLLSRLRDSTGFMFGPERTPEVEAAARQAMTRASVDGMPAWLALVDAGEASMSELIEELMVGETYFFREPEQLRLLDRVLPSLDGPTSIWSAGCASGEEAYSLAINVSELDLTEPTSILATDISGRSLAKARSARYGEWSLRGPHTDRARRWLASDGLARPTYTVDAHIRAAVVFQTLNLVSDPFPSGQNIIFCRNVLVYLQRQVVDRIACRFYDALVEGGWLVLASSDPGLGPPFEAVHTEQGVLYRRSRATAAMPMRPTSSPPAPPPRERPRRASPPARPRQTSVAPARPEPRTEEHDAIAAVWALADQGDLLAAGRAAESAATRAPMNAEIHYLLAVLLTEQHHELRAVESLRRALYVNPRFVMAWMTLGTALRDLGDTKASKRAFGQVRELCGRLGVDEPIPMADGVTSAYLAGLAAREESRL